MKLYYAPGACSLSPHIVLREAGLSFNLVKVSTKTKEMEGGGDFRSINSKGYVPALELDEGGVLTEGPAIVQYLADKAPHSGLAPTNGTLGRYRLQEWLNFITTELHKQFSPLFDPTTADDVKAKQREKIGARLEWVSGQLGAKPYLTGETFTVADAYLFVILNWAPKVGVDLSPWANIKAFHERVGARPKVQEALKAEGLLK